MLPHHLDEYPQLDQLNQYRVAIGEALEGTSQRLDMIGDDLELIEEKCAKLQLAAQGITALINDHAYPLRYSLHLIELSCGLDGWYQLLNQRLYRDAEHPVTTPLYHHLDVQQLQVKLQTLLCSHRRYA